MLLYFGQSLIIMLQNIKNDKNKNLYTAFFYLWCFRVDPIPYDTPKPSGHTRFVCVSDTHARTDGVQMPYGDVLLHTGDFTELGLPSEVKKFNDWLGKDPKLLPTGCTTDHTHSRCVMN